MLPHLILGFTWVKGLGDPGWGEGPGSWGPGRGGGRGGPGLPRALGRSPCTQVLQEDTLKCSLCSERKSLDTQAEAGLRGPGDGHQDGSHPARGALSGGGRERQPCLCFSTVSVSAFLLSLSLLSLPLLSPVSVSSTVLSRQKLWVCGVGDARPPACVLTPAWSPLPPPPSWRPGSSSVLDTAFGP